MSNSFDSTLFLVGTPFQCLCMFEAINYFGIENFDVIVVYSDEYSLAKIELLLSKKQITYSKRNITHIIYGIMPLLFSRHAYYRNIFIGNFYNANAISLSYILASLKAKIFFLDDGVQVLSFFSDSPRIIKYRFKAKLIFAFYKLIGLLKLVDQPIFFTIFEVSSTKYEIIRNPLSLLKSYETEVEKKGDVKGVYIIGTNSSILEFRDYTYDKFLSALSVYITNKFPGEKIYYCPHRRDQNILKIQTLCEKLNIQIYHTKISVEYDFLEDRINPKLIVGFTSNALYTLRMLYPHAIVETVMYHLKSDTFDEETHLIRSRMNQSGISTLYVL